jgi:MFS superfamily sulfate permease-like transporter
MGRHSALIVCIIAIGILSRTVHTGWVVLDKYLGDALYAAMVYAILRLRWRPPAAAVSTIVVMTGLELFQLTLIPARLLESEFWLVRICARLLGTQFSFMDLLAYGVGVGCIYFADQASATRMRSPFWVGKRRKSPRSDSDLRPSR